jgi:hypothetical protein
MRNFLIRPYEGTDFKEVWGSGFSGCAKALGSSGAADTTRIKGLVKKEFLAITSIATLRRYDRSHVSQQGT